MAPTAPKFKKGNEGSDGKKKTKSLKQKIRGIKRMLKQPDLPATVRATQERMLLMLEDNVKERSTQETNKNFDKKYKMVKFFEKRKGIRRYKQCCKRLADCSEEERIVLEQEIEKIRKDINYITYFPIDCKYISVYPPEPYTDNTIIKQQESIYDMICSKVSEGELNDALEGVENTEDSPIREAHRQKKKLDKRERMRIKKSKQVLSNDTKDKEEKKDVEEKPEGGQIMDDFFLDSTPGQDEPEGVEEESSNPHRKANPKFVVLGMKEKRTKSKEKTTHSHRKTKKQKKE